MDQPGLVTAPARTLLASVVDYAGLFPPASLPLPEAIAEYARARRSAQSWLLGRFVVPATQLEELASALEAAGPSDGPWALSVLLVEPAADAARIAAFERRNGALARVTSVEAKAMSLAEAEALLDGLPAGRTGYLEIQPSADLGQVLARLRARGARAKVRTGGVVATAIPSPSDLARFISACANAGVAFKATAGLHHPLRAEHPLTYAPEAPRAVMHGFLNVLAAAALARSGAVADLEAVLREESPAAFRLDETGLTWRRLAVTEGALAECRASFAISFGSCSFDEPVAGLRALGLL